MKFICILFILFSNYVIATPVVTWEFVECSDVERGAKVSYEWKNKGLYKNHTEKEVKKVRWVSSDELKLVMYYTYDKDYGSYNSYSSKVQCEQDKDEAKKENDIFNNLVMLEHLAQKDPKFKEILEKRRAMEPELRKLWKIQFETHMKETKEKIDYYCKKFGKNAIPGTCE